MAFYCDWISGGSEEMLFSLFININHCLNLSIAKVKPCDKNLKFEFFLPFIALYSLFVDAFYPSERKF